RPRKFVRMSPRPSSALTRTRRRRRGSSEIQTGEPRITRITRIRTRNASGTGPAVAPSVPFVFIRVIRVIRGSSSFSARPCDGSTERNAVLRMVPFGLFGLLFLASSRAGAADAFALLDGDRVVWLGSTVIEQEQRYGYWETALTTNYPDRNITFR